MSNMIARARAKPQTNANAHAHKAQELLRKRVVGENFWWYVSQQRQRNFRGSTDIWSILDKGVRCHYLKCAREADSAYECSTLIQIPTLDPKTTHGRILGSRSTFLAWHMSQPNSKNTWASISRVKITLITRTQSTRLAS